MLNTQHTIVASGLVRHRRFLPRPHQLKQHQHMLLINLNAIASRWSVKHRWSWFHRAGLRFRRADYMQPEDMPLRAAVLEKINAAGYNPPDGDIIFLGHLRQWGMCMNPVCFYFCYNKQAQLHTIVAEITNTPWGERHAYVLPVNDAIESEESRQSNRWQFQFEKAFHVSPFMPMDLHYKWSFSMHNEHLVIYMQLQKGERNVFDASLNLKLKAQQKPDLIAWKHPLQCQRVWLGIYWNALLLKLKGISDYPHPIRSRQRK